MNLLRARKMKLLLALFILAALTLAACSKGDVAPAGSEAASAAPANGSAAKKYIDSKGREVEVPAQPRRIVYVGSDPGDLIALGVKPLGASLSVIGTQVVYPDLLQGIEDIGYPANLEKVTALDPDVILFSDWDEKAIDALARIAPTAVIEGTGTFDRVRKIAEAIGKTAEADDFIASYEAKAEQIKTRLKLADGSGATATVFLQMGKSLYVMGHQGLSVTLFDALGFRPADKVKQLIDKGERFAEISAEVLPDYAGDEIFVLSNGQDETKQELDRLLAGNTWRTLPAVKKGRVHQMDSQWNFDDPITRDRLLDELQNLLSPSRSYTDAMGRKVELPAHPERIVAHYYASEFVALGLPVIGTNYINASGILTQEQLQGMEDVGGEGVVPNLEKVVALDPDLIAVPNFLEPADLEALSKIAPTVALDYGSDVFARLRTIGEITGSSARAEDWIAAYEAKAEEKRKEAASMIQPGETASAFILYQDKQLYVYGPQRLGPIMYDALGFAMPPKVKELFDRNKDALWETISLETLPDYAGDRIFLVVPDDSDDTKKRVEEVLNGPIWKGLPAVKNGKAYVVESRWAFNDPLTLDWLLGEMPKKLR